MAFPLLLGLASRLPLAGRFLPALGRAVTGRAALVGGAGFTLGGIGRKRGGGAGIAGGADDELFIRRRRKRALTSDDLRVALTIASAISKKAAENFILQRTRR